MKLIKFDTISSTSDFLKDLSKTKTLENFTTVVAETQTNGRGQMNSTWNSGNGENLLFTTYVCLKGLSLHLIPYFSFLVAVTLYKVIGSFLENEKGLKVKWPNDILSYNSKMAGILIENTLKKNKLECSFIGIGLNVNQLEFPETLRKATSMRLLGGKNFDKEEILNAVLEAFKKVLHVDYINTHSAIIKQKYLLVLYKINTPAMFIDKNNQTFMGKIVGVNEEGLLILEKSDENKYSYSIKEIAFA